MEVTVKSELRQDFKSSCECLKTNLARVRLKAMDKLQVHRDTYMCMYYVYVICIEAIDVSTINATTITKFENENAATKHTVFLSELNDY